MLQPKYGVLVHTQRILERLDYLDGVDHLENALWLLGNLTGDSEKMCEHVLENVHLGECMFEMLR